MSTVPFGTSALIEQLESLNADAPPTFQALLKKLWDMRFQGQLILSFAGGLPRAVVVQQAVQMRLDTGSP